jgi:putative transcriptional regulator
MNRKKFQELLQSMRQGADILRGRSKPSRKFVSSNPDVRSIRKGLKLSQSQFARLMGISVATLKNWEQGRRKPVGPGRILLGVAALHPEVLPDIAGIEN